MTRLSSMSRVELGRRRRGRPSSPRRARGPVAAGRARPAGWSAGRTRPAPARSCSTVSPVLLGEVVDRVLAARGAARGRPAAARAGPRRRPGGCPAPGSRRRAGRCSSRRAGLAGLAVQAFEEVVEVGRRPRRGSLPDRRHPGRPRRMPGPNMIVLGIDPGTANTGYGVVARRGGRLAALDGGVHRDRRRRWRSSAGWPPSSRAWRSCSTSTSPPRSRSRSSTSARNARSAFAVGQARGVVMLAAGRRGIACSRLHAAAGQGRGVRQRPRRQGPGPADGPGRALAARAAAARPRRRRARRRDLPRQPRAAGWRRSGAA